jgi:uncharacterized Zn-binding protein involved in type VI secretion
MGKPAARIGDMHVCPMITVLVPHVGGPVVGPGCPTVLIGGMPAAVMGDMCVCVGPPDTIVLGSTGVMIGGKPAARMGDQCVHGGTIILGCPTVLIGETGSGGSAGSAAVIGGAMGGTGDTEAITPAKTAGLSKMPKNALQLVKKDAPPQLSVIITQALALKEAAVQGAALVHNPQCCSACAPKMKS